MRYYIDILDLGFESFVVNQDFCGNLVNQDFCGNLVGMSDTRLGYKRDNKGLK